MALRLKSLMKAKFLALLLFLFLLYPMGMNAESHRIWDFTKGLSARTVENLNADEEHWAQERIDENGVTDRWKIVGEFSYSEPLKANGEIIAEADELLFTIAGQPTNSILISQDNLRLGRPNSTITFPRMRNGQTITIVGQSPNKTAEMRGIFPVQDYLKYVGDKNLLVDGECIFLGRAIPGSQDVYMFSWQVETDEEGDVDVQFQIGPEGGIDFMMFAIDITQAEKDNIMARGEILKYQTQLRQLMNDYIEKLSYLSENVQSQYSVKLQEVYKAWYSKLQALIDKYYPTFELSSYLSEAAINFSDGEKELDFTYSEAYRMDQKEVEILPCRNDYVLVCDDWTANGTQRPGAGVLFGDDYFLDVTGGAVSNAKRSVDLSNPDGELVTPEIASRYGGYGNHLNSLRLKNAQDVISMNVVKDSKIILFYNNHAYGRHPLFCRDKEMKDVILAESFISGYYDDILQRMEWTAPDDMVVYIGSEGGDIHVSYIIVEATSLKSITVNLTQGVDASEYANMCLEIRNVQSGQKLTHEISNQGTYVFRNIPDNTVWNLILRNDKGDVFGRIDNISVSGSDVDVTFDNLIKPQNVTLSVVTPAGEDVTSKTQLKWTDEYGYDITVLNGLLPGTKLNYEITLSKDLAMQYVTPDRVEYTVAETENQITHQLLAIKQVQATGTVKDASTGMAIVGAIISASQTFAGMYEKTITTETDSLGNYSLCISNVPTTINASAPDYISQNLSCDAYMNGKDEIKLPDVHLKPITGATVILSFTYTKSVADGETPDVNGWYDDYNNIVYSIFNKTKGKPVSKFNLQHPIIVLLEESAEGDVLELTATSKTSAFMPVTTMVTIDSDLRGEATFNIVELGKIHASFEKNSNQSVVGSLYDSNGKLLKSYDYVNAELTVDNLSDGNYTLVSMGGSKLFNTIYDLSQLPQSGLVSGIDYTQNSVNVKSGVVSIVRIEEIPTLDERQFYYTGSNTYFTVNKLSVISGQYLTLSSALDFKSEYSSDVTDVKLIVDMPESCAFVDNSVLIGNAPCSYVLNGSRLTIPVDDCSDRIRFCIIPTLGGDYVSSAFAQFNINGKTVTQPIGSVNYSAKDMMILVPSVVCKPSIPVSGTTIGASSIDVYDGDVIIGHTTSLENGVWALSCELDDPYNLSNHNIYARVKTKTGLELISETKNCFYDMNGIQVSKVKMIHWNSDMSTTYESVYDFLNPKSKPNQWALDHHNKKFTYTIEFTENDPERISNVVLYVHTADGQYVPSAAVYDEDKGFWTTRVDLGDGSGGYYPLNCSVDFDYTSTKCIDVSEINDSYEVVKELLSRYESDKSLLNTFFEDNQDLDYDSFMELTNKLGIPIDIRIDSNINILPEGFELWSEEQQDEYIESELNNIISDNNALLESLEYINSTFSIDNNLNIEVDGTALIVKSCAGISVDELLVDGFKEFPTTSGNKVYSKISETAIICVDFENDIYIESSIPQSQEKKVSVHSDNSKTGLQKYSECMGYIKKALDIINLKWTELQSLANFPEEKLDEAIHTIESRLKRVTKWKNSSKKLGKKLKWAIEEDRLAHALAGTKLAKKICGSLVGRLLKAVPFAGYIATLNDCYHTSDEILTLYNYIPKECPDDKAHAQYCRDWCYTLWTSLGALAIIDVLGSFSSDVGIVGGVIASFATGGTSLGATAVGTVAKAVIVIGGFVADMSLEWSKSELEDEIPTIKCYKDRECGDEGMPPCTCKKTNPTNNGGGKNPSGAPNDNVRVDPSGYVYECVPSNRLEGVTATVFYKEMIEDMFGEQHENIVQWDAAEYGQENPLITDKNGFYRWDVPMGLWQVKYEKEGYETTYSDWLPVPPPQLEVNIAMKQAVAPNVVDAHAYEDAVEFEFDKYMLPSLLNTDNIKVVVEGKTIDGTIKLLNEESSSEGGSDTFASRVRFCASEVFNAKELTLNISNNVENYAGVRMLDAFSKTLPIEYELRKIVCDSIATVGYGDSEVITVSVLPAEASAGKMLNVLSTAPMIASTNVQKVRIGEDGQAEILVSGELPGSCALVFSVDGSGLSASTVVNVKRMGTVEAPVASVASGTTVEMGTEIALSCATEGATIYYTLDGSCPCVDSSSRKVYDGTPIVVTEDITISAMATAPEMYDSEIAEFTYIVEDSGIDEVSVDEDLKIYPLPVHDTLNISADGNIIKNVIVSDISGAIVAKSNVDAAEVSLDVSHIDSGIYIVVIETANNTYSRKIIKY